MIPIKLSLRNFMCYRDKVPPLYFEGIHTACFCGDNGNGKSALLDAITWALWGKARAKSDDEFIHLGQREMEVEFDFAVDATHYRVLRKRTRSKPGQSGQTVLEFQIATPEGFKAISGNSVAETQRRIIQTLHMDYLTFINSAYLRQGHADEFTIKQPGERKRVLADILGLSLYDELEERAKSYAKEREQQQRELQSAIVEMEREIGRKEEYETELLKAKRRLVELDKEIKTQEEQVNSLRSARKALEFKQEQLSELRERIKQGKEELSYWQSQATKYSRKVEEYAKILQQCQAIEKGYAQLQETKKEAEELNTKLGQLVALKERKAMLERTIADARGELITQQRLALHKVGELEAQSQRMVKLGEELEQIHLQLGEIALQEELLKQKKQQAEEIALQIQHLRSTNLQLREELKGLEDKLALLQQGEARCPLCETELGISGKQKIEEKYKVEASSKAEAQGRNEILIKGKERDCQELENQIRQLGLKVDKEKKAQQSREAVLEREIIQAEEAASKLPEERAELAKLEERLSKKDFALEQQRGFQEVEEQIAGLGYDAEKHHQVRQHLVKLEIYEGWQRKLEMAQQSFSSEEAALAGAKRVIASTSSNLESMEQRVATLSAELSTLPDLTRRLTEAEQAYSSLLECQAHAQKELGAVQQKFDHCSYLEREREEKRRLVLWASKEREIYEELAKAFSKKGIQAFIIELAIPEVEAEANRLLSQMTDNKMSISIETQRETKKGEIIETLDIKISDELGTRSYEMYSGGEAFRIDFALRIALSRLLARRAGAPLSTLFIDEGFGTQDSSGLDKLVGAINSIQEDFEKIIVITHLEELKDAFPVRIDITKTAEGSMISMS